MMTTDDRDIADRVVKARAHGWTSSDPYVRALVSVADAVAYYFDVRLRYKYSDVNDTRSLACTLREYTEAESRLKALIGWVSHGLIERALGKVGAEHEPPQGWEQNVLARVAEPKRIGIRGWWRALWSRRWM